MPDLRYDPVNDQWIAIAENRLGRPSEFEPAARPVPLAQCPFCLGNEDATPDAIATYHLASSFAEPNSDVRTDMWHDRCQTQKTATSHQHETGQGQFKRPAPVSSPPFSDTVSAVDDARVLPNGSDTAHLTRPWITRVIPNRFPAFGFAAPSLSLALAESVIDSPYAVSGTANNYQELIIESSRHVEGYSQLNEQELASAFLVYRERLLDLQRDHSLQHAMLFKNCRYEAGASLSHVHSQLIAMDFVPPAIAAKSARLAAPTGPAGNAPSLLAASGPAQCLLQQVADFEATTRRRVVLESQHWIAFCPFASRFAYQTWIVSKSDPRPYWCQSGDSLRELAVLVQQLIVALEMTLDMPAYNVLFHNPPFGQKECCGQSYLEVFARVSNPAGFEWGTDCWINPVSPETAAQRLRTGLKSG